MVKLIVLKEHRDKNEKNKKSTVIKQTNKGEKQTTRKKSTRFRNNRISVLV
jgi:hypothetical protein